MNIALPALVIFACLLPGFIFRSRLKLVESTSLDYSPFGRIVSEAIVWAAVLHIVWVSLCPMFGDVADIGLVLRLLSSNLTIHGDALKEVAQQTPRIIKYFASLYLAAYLIPTIFRKVITSSRLDRFDSPLSWLFRFHDAPWYYLLTGADFDNDEQPDYIQATAIVDVAGEAYIFRGVLDRFYFKSDGTLDRLVLENTTRRKLSEDKGARRGRRAVKTDEERFYTVEGDSFVIQYDQVVTLNIQYVKLAAVDEQGKILPSGTAANESTGA